MIEIDPEAEYTPAQVAALLNIPVFVHGPILSDSC
jgi:hypothetical protein